jgi:7-keto-8-aminopelargonate synthetase-like enzyme
MFECPVILSSSTSLGHQAVIPIIINDNDAVIIDHQAHISMQDTIQKLQIRGVTITLLRHSRIDELEKKIKELGPKHKRIWYFFDGVYSMYGDLAPIEDIKILKINTPNYFFMLMMLME